jgi:hypothetical protein
MTRPGRHHAIRPRPQHALQHRQPLRRGEEVVVEEQHRVAIADRAEDAVALRRQAGRAAQQRHAREAGGHAFHIGVGDVAHHDPVRRPVLAVQLGQRFGEDRGPAARRDADRDPHAGSSGAGQGRGAARIPSSRPRQVAR